MMALAVYDEAEPFQTYSRVLRPQLEIYSNSAELNLTQYTDSGDAYRRYSDSVQEPSELLDSAEHDRHQEDRSSRASWDGSSCRGENVDELDGEKEDGNEKMKDDAWNIKLRKNWERHVRKKAGHNKKYKKSDNRQSIGGSLSRFVAILSRCFTSRTRAQLLMRRPRNVAQL